jgi:3'-phosphoadenosine 5'-phosphosulfate sulfotransferase (PAPS reductase)/FAD synthetase
MQVSTTPEIDALIASHSPVAIGVSGGKDSSAVAFATISHLNRVGHRGPRLLVHSDLGVTEWKESLEWCNKLADRLGLELAVVRREKGDMMDRWEQRWSDNVARYETLRCVQLILPWSTPDMRFCTSEMKVAPICHGLSTRFPGSTIVNVTGIRRQESTGRAKAPIAKDQPKLTSVTRDTNGIDWHPIIDWTLDDVLSYLETMNFPLHPAYLVWMLSRVSCVFCIMSNRADLQNAARCPSNHEIYRRMVRLEIRSTFAFHGNIWLGDIAPDLMSESEQEQLFVAKSKAEARRALEVLIPKDLLYVKGWPIAIPTREAADLLCGIRQQVGQIIGLDVDYIKPQKLIDRYEELWNFKHGEGRR